MRTGFNLPAYEPANRSSYAPDRAGRSATGHPRPSSVGHGPKRLFQPNIAELQRGSVVRNRCSKNPFQQAAAEVSGLVFGSDIVAEF